MKMQEWCIRQLRDETRQRESETHTNSEKWKQNMQKDRNIYQKGKPKEKKKALDTLKKFATYTSQVSKSRH